MDWRRLRVDRAANTEGFVCLLLCVCAVRVCFSIHNAGSGQMLVRAVSLKVLTCFRCALPGFYIVRVFLPPLGCSAGGHPVCGMRGLALLACLPSVLAQRASCEALCNRGICRAQIGVSTYCSCGSATTYCVGHCKDACAASHGPKAKPWR